MFCEAFPADLRVIVELEPGVEAELPEGLDLTFLVGLGFAEDEAVDVD
jgi:hypothetical protein